VIKYFCPNEGSVIALNRRVRLPLRYGLPEAPLRRRLIASRRHTRPTMPLPAEALPSAGTGVLFATDGPVCARCGGALQIVPAHNWPRPLEWLNTTPDEEGQPDKPFTPSGDNRLCFVWLQGAESSLGGNRYRRAHVFLFNWHFFIGWDRFYHANAAHKSIPNALALIIGRRAWYLGCLGRERPDSILRCHWSLA